MNTKVNPRTFTDHIPAYREKTAFLQKLGRQDLADVHNYFFYKRLLLFYNELKKGSFPEKKQYLREITSAILQNVPQNREDYDRIYSCSVAGTNEKRKMDLFLKSPTLYWIVMVLNEAVVLPLKQYRGRHGRTGGR